MDIDNINDGEKKELTMKKLAFGTATPASKLPAEFANIPLRWPAIARAYCNLCGESIDAEEELAALLCKSVKLFGEDQECDPQKIDWTKNYILTHGCPFCGQKVREISIEKY